MELSKILKIVTSPTIPSPTIKTFIMSLSYNQINQILQIVIYQELIRVLIQHSTILAIQTPQ